MSEVELMECGFSKIKKKKQKKKKNNNLESWIYPIL
jgi:hypothetical protein